MMTLFLWSCQKDPESDLCTDCAEMTTFTFLAYNNNNLTADVAGTIGSDRTITVRFPAKTNLTALVPNFIHTGAEVLSDNQPQVSGRTIRDFSTTGEIQRGGT